MKMRWLVAGASVAMVVTSCGGDDGGSSSSAFCKAAQETEDSSNAFSKLLGGSDVPDSDATKKALEDLIKKSKAALKVAPSAIKDDIQTLIEGSESFQELFEKADYDLLKAAQDEEFQKLAEDTDRDDAAKNVSKYLADECGIEDTDTPDTTEGTTDTTEASDTTAESSNSNSGEATQAQIDALKGFFPKLSEDQLRCLIEKGLSVSGGEAPNTNVLTECNISLADLTP